MTKKPLSIIRVKGQSMLPFYKDGDFVIITRIFSRFLFKKNRDVVFIHKELGLLIKRVQSVNRREKVIKVFGTAGASLSSAKIGKVRFENIIGVVLLRI